MSVFDETWTVDLACRTIRIDDDTSPVSFECAGDDRLRLAAAAPEMYRLLDTVSRMDCLPPNYEDKIKALLRKARGE